MSNLDIKGAADQIDALLTEGCVLQAKEKTDKIIASLKKIADATDDFERKNKLYNNIAIFFDIAQQITIVLFNFKEFSEKVDTISHLPSIIFCPIRSIYGSYLNPSVKEIHITEALDYKGKDFESVLYMLQVFHSMCTNLKFIKLLVKNDPIVAKQQQVDVVLKIVKYLKDNGINYQFEFDLWSRPEHRVTLSTGFIFEMDRSIHHIVEARKKLNPTVINVNVWHTTALQKIRFSSL